MRTQSIPEMGTRYSHLHRHQEPLPSDLKVRRLPFKSSPYAWACVARFSKARLLYRTTFFKTFSAGRIGEEDEMKEL